MDTPAAVTEYDQVFFDKIREGAHRSALEIVPLVAQLLQPNSVVDVGCGTGDWLAAFVSAGITDVLGIDGPWAKPERIPSDKFVPADLSTGFSVDRTFDLAISLEVAEHLPETSAQLFVDSLVKLAPMVLFSAAVPHQRGTSHVNEQWPTYWVELFRHHQYVPVDCVRPRIWNNDGVEWWYAQNTILYVQQSYLERRPDLQREADQTGLRPVAMIHPRGYLSKVQEINMAYARPDASRMYASALIGVAPTVLANAVRRKLRRR